MTSGCSDAPGPRTGNRAGRAFTQSARDVCPPDDLLGHDDEEIERVSQSTKQQIAFYGSTTAYRPVFEVHGWGDLHLDLNSMRKEGKWAEMAGLVSDEILEAIAVCGPMKDMAWKVRERCDGKIDRVSRVAHWTKDPDVWDEVLRELQAG